MEFMFFINPKPCRLIEKLGFLCDSTSERISTDEIHIPRIFKLEDKELYKVSLVFSQYFKPYTMHFYLF